MQNYIALTAIILGVTFIANANNSGQDTIGVAETKARIHAAVKASHKDVATLKVVSDTTTSGKL